MAKKKSLKEKKHAANLRVLSTAFLSAGIELRREKLSRGSAFRVKSGTCTLTGDNVLFLDRRLPIEQQLSLLSDYAIDLKLELSGDEFSALSQNAKALYQNSANVIDPEAVSATA